jgi:urease accessory protein
MDLAPHVGADLDVMRSDAERARGARPYVFTDMLRRRGLDEVIAFLEHKGGLQRNDAPAMSAQGLAVQSSR